jgi:hypothetical protein
MAASARCRRYRLFELADDLAIATYPLRRQQHNMVESGAPTEES